MISKKIVLGGESIKYMDQHSVNFLLDYAYNQGISCIDSAPTYGSSENLIGAYKGRNKFKISTKIGNPGGLLNLNEIIASVDKSLMNLRIEQINCIYIHSVDPKLVTNEVLNELESLVKIGKIATFGYSGDGQFLNSATAYSSRLRNFMCTFNIVDQGNYTTIINKPDLNWILKRPLANGIWHFGISKQILSIRQSLLGIENSHKSDVYWNRFNQLKEFGGIEKISLSMLVGYINRKIPLAKIVVGTRSRKHLSQLLKSNEISDKHFDDIEFAWNIMRKNHLEIRV